MSCCQRQPAPQAQRWAAAATGRAPAVGTRVPVQLRFTGPRPLSLPLGTRRVVVRPGEALSGVNEAERELLWRTGLFEAVG